MAENPASARSHPLPETAVPVEEPPHVAPDKVTRAHGEQQVDASRYAAADTVGDADGEVARDIDRVAAQTDVENGVTDEGEHTESGSWLPLVFGAVVALLISLLIAGTWLIGEIRS
ncbi:hypothetical protein [Nocardioides caldifontis]|uniref:hypothetical protein n=1 Tax=Nocardioides caldifontis TaxID=2588938 RepID=UPI0011E06D7B|nr:hypothetical protein [Nocardioides caldifontis]